MEFKIPLKLILVIKTSTEGLICDVNLGQITDQFGVILKNSRI